LLAAAAGFGADPAKPHAVLPMLLTLVAIELAGLGARRAGLRAVEAGANTRGARFQVERALLGAVWAICWA